MRSCLGAAPFLLVLMVLSAGGCGRGPKLYPVTGQVTLQDKPVADAAVLFYSKQGARPPQANTDAEGKFQLMSLPGEYTAIITKCESLTPESGMEVYDEDNPPKVRWIIPEKYSRPDQSDLKVVVKAGGENHFRFEFPRR